MSLNNLTSQQVSDWFNNIQEQISSLSHHLQTIQETIEFGGDSSLPCGIIEITKSNDTTLSDSWNNLFYAMDAARKKLDSKTEVFYSSIKTFTEMINQSNEENLSAVDKTTETFEKATDTINNL